MFEIFLDELKTQYANKSNNVSFSVFIQIYSFFMRKPFNKHLNNKKTKCLSTIFSFASANECVNVKWKINYENTKLYEDFRKMY